VRVENNMRVGIHPLAFLIGSLLLCIVWLSLRPTPPRPLTPGAAFVAKAAAHARERKTIELAREVLSRYAGAYLIEGIEIAIQLDAGRLFVVAPGTPRFELQPTADKDFYVAELDADIAFDVDSAGRVLSFAAKLPTGTITAKRAR
jgi:hypothetical protein